MQPTSRHVMAGAKDRIGSQGSALQSTGAGTSERARRDRGRQTAGGNGVRTCNFGQKRSTRLETEMHSRKRPREGAVSCSLEAASKARSLTECVRSTKLESIQATASSQAQVRAESLRQADRYATYIESKSSSGSLVPSRLSCEPRRVSSNVTTRSSLVQVGGCHLGVVCGCALIVVKAV